MKILKILVLGLSLFSTQIYATRLNLNDCLNRSTLYLSENLSDQNSRELLSANFNQVILKMALLQNRKGLKTLEDYSKSWYESLSENQKGRISEISKQYRQFGNLDDLEEVDNFFVDVNYWNKAKRFNNKKSSAFIYAHMMLDENSPFTESDASIVWLMDLANQAAEYTHGKFSATFNSTNFSNLLINYTGALKELDAYTVQELEELLKENNKKTEKALESIHKGLNIYLKNIGCLDENELFAGVCKLNNESIQQMLSKSINFFKDDTDLSIHFGGELERLTLKDTLEVDLGGKVLFQIENFQGEKIKRKRLASNEAVSINDALFENEKGLDRSEIIKAQKEINEIPEQIERIKSFMGLTSEEEYIVIDNQKNLLTVYSKTGEVLHTTPYDGAKVDDKVLSGGAGAYRVSGTSSNKGLSVQAQKSNKVRSFSRDLTFSVKQGTPLYVLPTEKGNEFIVKDGTLKLVNKVYAKDWQNTLYTPSHKEYRETKYVTKSPLTGKRTSNLETGGHYHVGGAQSVYNAKTGSANTFVDEYLSTLEKEKQKLMEIYKLTNDEYNQLVKFSVGVMMPESKMTLHPKYSLKESLPNWLVKLAKKVRGDRTVRSRGPTQMKYISKKLTGNYDISNDDLVKPRESAIATLAFSAELLADLKRLDKFHSDVNQDNMHEYLYYLYRGKRREIINGTADPELNRNTRAIKGVMDQILIYEVPKD